MKDLRTLLPSAAVAEAEIEAYRFTVQELAVSKVPYFGSECQQVEMYTAFVKVLTRQGHDYEFRAYRNVMLKGIKRAFSEYTLKKYNETC